MQLSLPVRGYCHKLCVSRAVENVYILLTYRGENQYEGGKEDVKDSFVMHQAWPQLYHVVSDCLPMVREAHLGLDGVLMQNHS